MIKTSPNPSQTSPNPSQGGGLRPGSFEITKHPGRPDGITPPWEGQGEVLRLGYYSPSQNGMVIDPRGIAHCLCGGGRGHDVDKPKILIVYD